jgi:hypothetical protein
VVYKTKIIFNQIKLISFTVIRLSYYKLGCIRAESQLTKIPRRRYSYIRTRNGQTMRTQFKTPKLRVPLESIRQVIPSVRRRRRCLILRDVIRRPYRTRFDLEVDLELDLEFEFTPEVKVGPSRCPRSDESGDQPEPDVRRTNQLPINVHSV